MHLLLGIIVFALAPNFASSETISLQNPSGDVVAVVNTDAMHFAVANENRLIIQFPGGDQNRLTINNPSNEISVEVIQGWLNQLSGGSD